MELNKLKQSNNNEKIKLNTVRSWKGIKLYKKVN